MSLFAPQPPLAERLRPRRLEELVGQEPLLGPGKPLRRMVDAGRLSSAILWGPPGAGKTSLARVLAASVSARFASLSAVNAGLSELRAVAKEAEHARTLGQTTVFFLDEIHRFSRTQQDALLPMLETGLLILIGATTENPSFALTPALRSRAPIYALHPLEPAHLLALLQSALQRPEGLPGVSAEPAALRKIAAVAGGDARRALSLLELAVQTASDVSELLVGELLGREDFAMDRSGDAFYDLVSALHKSVRGCHVDAALYYLARLLAGGADPLYLLRRLIRMATEDVGLADPAALRVALEAHQAYTVLGSPEGDLALVQATAYLALAPKSNALYRAKQAADQAARSYPAAPVPRGLRNAPTALLAEQGNAQGYAYYFDDPEGSFRQPYLAPDLAGLCLFEPGSEGWEQRLASRLQELRRRFRATAEPG